LLRGVVLGVVSPEPVIGIPVGLGVVLHLFLSVGDFFVAPVVVLLAPVFRVGVLAWQLFACRSVRCGRRRVLGRAGLVAVRVRAMRFRPLGRVGVGPTLVESQRFGRRAIALEPGLAVHQVDRGRWRVRFRARPDAHFLGAVRVRVLVVVLLEVVRIGDVLPRCLAVLTGLVLPAGLLAAGACRICRDIAVVGARREAVVTRAMRRAVGMVGGPLAVRWD